MAEEIIEITVHPDGKVEMRVSGIPGMGCVTETEDLARLLGVVEAQELTGEAYQEDIGQRQQDRLWR